MRESILFALAVAGIACIVAGTQWEEIPPVCAFLLCIGGALTLLFAITRPRLRELGS